LLTISLIAGREFLDAGFDVISGAARNRSSAGPDEGCSVTDKRKSVGRLCRDFLFFFDQPFGERDELFAMASAAQGEEAFHQAETDDGRLIRIQKNKLWWHLDTIHC
jgi:hypothetical protein